MKVARVLLTGIMLLTCLWGCGKKSDLEGKLVDGKGKPIVGLKVVAKQTHGSNQAEATTGADGVFKISNLSAKTEYEVTPYLDDKTRSHSLKIETLSGGETLKLEKELVVFFALSKDGLFVNCPAFEQIWIRDAGKEGKMSWDAALMHAKKSTDGGFSDWRLPTRFELKTVAMYGGSSPADALNKDAFINVKPTCYWTSELNKEAKGYAWTVSMVDGKEANVNTDGSCAVWLVRKGK